jgi:CRP/FNR family transcriptional regulator, cyclic AMP receptor protein
MVRAMNAKRLAELSLFKGLDDDALNRLARTVQEVSVSEDSVLVREGDYSYDLSIIDEGEAVVERDGSVIARLGEGDVFGEGGVLHKDLRGATVRSRTPMRLITLTNWDMRRLRSSIPELESRLADLSAQRASE